MKNILALPISIICVTTLVNAQSYQIGHKQQTFVDASRSNRSITTEIYYPANTAGDNVAIATGQFPVLIFGHGFVMAWSAYNVEWNALVPSGYIMVFPTTETGFSPSHTDFGKDLAYLAGAMQTEGTNSSSFFFGSVAATSAVMGHSMGGGSSFLAVQYNPSITALATLAPANTNPSTITAAKNITLPSIIFSGANDCVAPPASNQKPMYDSLSSSCKTYVSVTGGSHCQFASSNTNCSFGESTCTPAPAISASAQQTTTFSLLLPWLNYYLKNDCSAGTRFQNLVLAGSGITSQQNCALGCTGTGIIENISHAIAYPNPFIESTTITIDPQSKINKCEFIMHDIFGREVNKMPIDNLSFTIHRNGLSNGIYFYEIKDSDNVTGKGKLTIE